MKHYITIIGAGRIGKAFLGVLAKEGHMVETWDSDPAKISHNKTLPELVSKADFIIICTPSWALRSVVQGFLPQMRTHAVVLSLTKGIEKETKKTMDAVLEETLSKDHPFILVGGPMLAEEMNQHLGGVAVFGTKNKATYERAAALFKKTQIKTIHSKDVRGVAVAGVLKNVYATALGIADGLGWGNNRKGWLVAEAISEMTEIMPFLLGKTETVLGPAGLGDLVATGHSPHSRNRQTGHELVQKGAATIPGEGSYAIPLIKKKLGKKIKHLPLFSALADILVEKKSIRNVFNHLLK